MTALEVVEFTDPLCPWAWGAEPTFRRLRALLPGARWRRAYAILFDPSADDPAPDPAAETAWYHRHLAEIAAHTGAPHPPRLERVARSSWPAALAAKAAEAQGAVVADAVLWRLRETLFTTGRPPDTARRVRAALRGIARLDLARLHADAAGPAVRAAVEADRALARRPRPEAFRVPVTGPHPGRPKAVDGGHRYALPTLVLHGPAGAAVVPGWRPLASYVDAVTRVSAAHLIGHISMAIDNNPALSR